MLKRRDRIERLDEAIAEGEQRITEQVFRILAMEARSEDATAAEQPLKAFELILFEYIKARASMAEARELAGPPTGP